MAKFRKKPVIVEAEQFLPAEGKIPKGICECLVGFSRHDIVEGKAKPHVHTMHKDQMVVLESGDWVVPEPDGEHYYPIKAEVFANNYEAVVESHISDDRLKIKFVLDGPLQVDPERHQLFVDEEYMKTGLFVRATFGQKMGNHDIVELEKTSLLRWLRSRGGDNPWAEDVVGILFGHGHLHPFKEKDNESQG